MEITVIRSTKRAQTRSQSLWSRISRRQPNTSRSARPGAVLLSRVILRSEYSELHRHNHGSRTLAPGKCRFNRGEGVESRQIRPSPKGSSHLLNCRKPHYLFDNIFFRPVVSIHPEVWKPQSVRGPDEDFPRLPLGQRRIELLMDQTETHGVLPPRFQLTLQAIIGFRSAPKKRRDESRRGRHECPRHYWRWRIRIGTGPR
jgi:hypothetical protein